MTPDELDDVLDRWEAKIDEVVAYAARGEREFGIAPIAKLKPMDPNATEVLTGILERPDISDEQRHRLDRVIARYRALAGQQET
jgi:hypothetical protein